MTLLHSNIFSRQEINLWEERGGPHLIDLVRAYPRTNDGLTGKCLEYTLAIGIKHRRPAHLVESIGYALDSLGISLDDLIDVQPWGMDKRDPQLKQLDVVRKYGETIYYWKKDAIGRPVLIRNEMLATTKYRGLAKADLIFIFKPKTVIQGNGWFVACSVKEHRGLFNPSPEHTSGIHFGLCLDNELIINWDGGFPVFGVRKLFGLGEALYSINENLFKKFHAYDLTEKAVENYKIFPDSKIRALASYVFKNRFRSADAVVSELLESIGTDKSIIAEMIFDEIGLTTAYGNHPPLFIRIT